MPRISLTIPPPAFPNMRIGLLGGSFNPAHEGHLRITQTALKRLRLDQVWWMVTPGNPIKDLSDLAPMQERLAQAHDLVQSPNIIVTGFESAHPSSYAWDTIRFLIHRYPATSFVWLFGGDNLALFHRWRRWREIFATLPIAVIDRPAFRHCALASPAARLFAASFIQEQNASDLASCPPPAWTYLSLPLCGLSSTAIRQARVNTDMTK